jgi:asparagine synthase (glutamine-hydrolysing)
MCGIAGILPARSADPVELDRLIRTMTQALIHRGPDDEGFHVDSTIALGMRRLSIIDIAHGAQPMRSHDGRLVLIYNGEIYNHRTIRHELVQSSCRFDTWSDTEVLLRVLETNGLDGVKHLEGMFAFALWDSHSRELTLARDWLGQKSLYVAKTTAGFAFASEIKALLKLPGVKAELDLQALSHYMSLRYLPGESTFFKGISKLAPAHALVVRDGSAIVRELWRPAYEPKLQLDESRLLDELDVTLREVVAEHLMSEVPIGCFLSGGIDSSLIVAYAAQATREPVRTFSIGVHEASQNELPWARQVAARYRTRHFETVVEPDLARLAPRMVAALEEPVDPFGAGVYVVSQIAAEHVTVALGGDGGDELFAGYDRYIGQYYAELYSRLPHTIRHRVLRPVLRRFPDSFEYNTLATRLRWIDRVSDYCGYERFAESATFLRFGRERKAKLFVDSVWRTIEQQVSERLLERFFADGCAETFVDRMLHADLMTRIADNDLPTTDRLSMVHSLELRAPLLDRRVCNLAMRIPAHLKLKKRRLKYITRRLAERHLPRALIYRPKKGFGFPLAHWLRGPLRGMMQRVIHESRFVQAGIFRADACQTMLLEHVGGTIDHNYRLWMLFNLELFWRHFIDGQSVEAVHDWVDDLRTGV